MSKLYLKVDTERSRTTKTVAANKEVRIQVFYGFSIKAYDLVISVMNGGFPVLDIEDSSSLLDNIKLNGKFVRQIERSKEGWVMVFPKKEKTKPNLDYNAEAERLNALENV